MTSTNWTVRLSRALALMGPAALVSCTPSIPSVICPTLSGAITSDTRLSGVCYRITSDMTVSGATLTVDPGVRLIFEQGTGLTVNSDGRFSAIGTADDPIVLTGDEPIRGFWDGVRYFGSNSVENQLAYVTFEYGGSSWDGNLFLDGTSTEPTRVAVRNCTFRQSEKYGVAFDDDVVVDAFTGNTLTANVLGAAAIDLTDVGILDATNSYTGNDADIIEVRGSRLLEEQTLHAVGVRYRPERGSTISALLTIEPGVTIEFGQAGGLTVDDEGQLSAVGTAAEPIVLTGQEPTRGFWAGLRFFGSNSTSNRLEYVTIEYGGGGQNNANLDIDGTSSLPSRVEVRNCTLRQSSGYGFYLDGDVNIPALSDVTATENATGPAFLQEPELIGFLDGTGTFSGNDVDVVEVSGARVVTDQTWPVLDVPYLFTRGFTVEAELTIEPGTELRFAQSVEMRVDSDGRLSAVGTPTEPILFTGDEMTPGFWAGLLVFGSNSAINRLEYVTVEYAGGGVVDGNLELDGTSSLPTRIEVVNSTFRNGARWGVYVDQDVVFNDDIETANTFSANANGTVRFP